MTERGMNLLLVVGSPNSSNAARLVEVGTARGLRGYLIDKPEEIDAAWLNGVSVVGVTAGASTPEHVVQAVIDRLRDLGATSVENCITVEEDTVFQLPPGLKQAVSTSNAVSPARLVQLGIKR